MEVVDGELPQAAILLGENGRSSALALAFVLALPAVAFALCAASPSGPLLGCLVVASPC